MPDTDPLRVEFTVREGECWKDPDGIGWYVTDADSNGAGITLERTLVERVADPHEFCRTWRKVDG